MQKHRLGRLSLALLVLATATLPAFGSEILFTFDGTSLQSPMWQQSGNSCGWPIEQGGELVMAQVSGCFGAGESISFDPTNTVIQGDFDATVDFRLPDFSVPNPGDRVTGLRVLKAADRSYVATIERYNRVLAYCNPAEQNYKAWATVSENCSPQVVWIPTGDMSGQFRIMREGLTLRLFYFGTSDWQEVLSRDVTADDVIITLFAAIPWGESGHDVRFDNLRIVTDGFVSSTGQNDLSGGGLSIQAYPNPAYLQTSIRIRLPDARFAALRVFGANGRQVAELIRPAMLTGTHDVLWNGRDDFGELLPAGVYLARVESPAGGTATKVVLIR